MLHKYKFNTELSDLLWAEDGSIFINEAYKYGIKSLIMPYFGYLHLYPRLFAYMATFVDIKYVQYVYVFGWSLSLIVLIYVSINCLNDKVSNKKYIFLIVLLLLMQPSSGEIFFTLTNSQWMLGFVLVGMVFFDPAVTKYFKYTIIAILSLTGPFCVFVAAIMFLYVLINKTNRVKIEFLILVACSLVQLFYISSSNRIGGSVENSAFDWSVAFVRFIMFGIRYDLLYFAMIGFFWAGFVVLCRRQKIDLLSSSDLNTPEAKALFTGLLFFLASLFMSTDSIVLLSSTGPGSRYYWIPYSSFIIYFGLKVKDCKYEKYLLISILLAIFVIQEQTIIKEKMYYNSYLKFASYEDIKIPINPMTNKYPGWHIDSSLLGIDKNSRCKRVLVYDAIYGGYECEYESISNDVGIIVEVSNYMGGVATINVKEAGGKDVKLKRYFEPLSSKLYFAYTKTTQNIIVSARDLVGGGANISAIKLYDLQ